MDNTDIDLVASWIKFFKLIEDSPVDTLFHFNVSTEILEIVPVPDTLVFCDYINARQFYEGDVYVFYSRPSRNLYPFVSCVKPGLPLYLLFPTALIQVSVDNEDPLPVSVIEASSDPLTFFALLQRIRVNAKYLPL